MWSTFSAPVRMLRERIGWRDIQSVHSETPKTHNETPATHSEAPTTHSETPTTHSETAYNTQWNT